MSSAESGVVRSRVFRLADYDIKGTKQYEISEMRRRHSFAIGSDFGLGKILPLAVFVFATEKVFFRGLAGGSVRQRCLALPYCVVARKAFRFEY